MSKPQNAIEALDFFITNYLQAALWSSNDESTPEGGEPFDKNYDNNDFHFTAIGQAYADCGTFFREHYQLFEGREAEAGHDFWLTRNGHGAGFFDGDWPEEDGEILTAASEAFGEVDIYLGDDGAIYCS